jgi:hypothetical protein
MPIQRVPRYELLLRELLKITPPNHSDYDNIVLALEKIKSLAAFVNRWVKVLISFLPHNSHRSFIRLFVVERLETRDRKCWLFRSSSAS